MPRRPADVGLSLGKRPAPHSGEPPRDTMGRPRWSKVSRHPKLRQIETEIAIGRRTDEEIAAEFGTPEHPLTRLDIVRHRPKLPEAVRAARYLTIGEAADNLETLKKTEASGLLANIAQQRGRLLDLQDKAIRDGDPAIIVATSKQIQHLLKLSGEYLGEFINRSEVRTVNIHLTPEFFEFRSRLLDALAPFPEARIAAAATFKAIDPTRQALPAPTGVEVAP